MAIPGPLRSVKKGGNISVPVTLTVTSGSTTKFAHRLSSSSVTTATLSWAPSTSTNLAGYKVYMGTASGVFSSSLTIGNTTTYTASNLGVGHTYYFAVTAYNGSGIESSYSNEVSKSIYQTRRVGRCWGRSDARTCTWSSRSWQPHLSLPPLPRWRRVRICPQAFLGLSCFLL